jgi:hypothetical protein
VSNYERATSAMDSVTSSVTTTIFLIVGSYFVSAVIVFMLYKAKIVPKALLQPLSLIGFAGLAYLLLSR